MKRLVVAAALLSNVSFALGASPLTQILANVRQARQNIISIGREKGGTYWATKDGQPQLKALYTELQDFVSLLQTTCATESCIDQLKAKAAFQADVIDQLAYQALTPIPAARYTQFNYYWTAVKSFLGLNASVVYRGDAGLDIQKSCLANATSFIPQDNPAEGMRVANLACGGASAPTEIADCLKNAYGYFPGSSLETYELAAIACTHNSNAGQINDCVANSYDKLPGSDYETYLAAALSCSASHDPTLPAKCLEGVQNFLADVEGSKLEKAQVAASACRGVRNETNVVNCMKNESALLDALPSITGYQAVAKICSSAIF